MNLFARLAATFVLGAFPICHVQSADGEPRERGERPTKADYLESKQAAAEYTAAEKAAEAARVAAVQAEAAVLAAEGRALMAMPKDQFSQKLPLTRREVLIWIVSAIGEAVVSDAYENGKEKFAKVIEAATARAEAAKFNKDSDINRYMRETITRDRERYQKEKIDSGDWSKLHPDRQNEILDSRVGKIKDVYFDTK